MVRIQMLLLAATLALLAIVSMQTVSAGSMPVNDSQEANVDVNIARRTWINIDPSDMFWDGVEPGTAGDSTEETHGYYAIQIENIGSINITYIWFNATYERVRPFVTGAPLAYDAGNFVAIAREGSEQFQFPNRVDFNESRSLVYLRDPAGNLPPDAGVYHYGRFRNTSKEYFWFVDKVGSAPTDYCNETGTAFYLGDAPHSRDTSGSVDFSGCSGNLVSTPGTAVDSCRLGTLGNDPDNKGWGWADVRVGDENYTVAVNYQCNVTMWSRWNIDAPGGRLGRGTDTFWNGTLHRNFTPGNSTIAEIKVHVPYGVASGNVTTGLLRVLANDM
jgi:hypothetical protein